MCLYNYANNLIQKHNKKKNTFVQKCTCSQKEHLISPIHSVHHVHSDCGEAVVHSCSHHQGALVCRVYGMVHKGMSTHKIDSFIGKGFGAVNSRSKCSSRALGLV